MGRKNDVKTKMYAAWMKDHKVIRRTARCCICYRIVSIPMDNHYKFGC